MENNTAPTQITLDTGASRILSAQAAIISVIVWIFYAYSTVTEAQAACYGGCIAMFNVWLTQRRLQTAVKIAQISPGSEVAVLYIAAVQRFVFTIVFFILGMWWLQFPPLPILITFTAAQVGYFFKPRTV
jgi:ATP synthase protein I